MCSSVQSECTMHTSPGLISSFDSTYRQTKIIITELDARSQV